MIKRIGFTAVAVLTFSLAAQSQTKTHSFSELCVKVKDGKWSEYAAFLRDVQGPVLRAQVTTGEIFGFAIGMHVIPRGTSARCDYGISLSYSSFPSSENAQASEAAFKLSGVKMTRDAYIAKQSEYRLIVGKYIWRVHESVGGPVKIGDYVRSRSNKVKGGMMTDWTTLESSGWKGMAEAAMKTNPGTGWRLLTLSMPGGSSLPYNARTLDVFPSWSALGAGIPVNALWKTVHPEQDRTAYFNKVNSMTDVTLIEVVKIIDTNTK